MLNVDGIYNSSSFAYPFYCDMTTDGGGWTLLATKVSALFTYIVSFAQGCAVQLNTDCGSSLSNNAPWSQVLFRFRSASPFVATIYTRKNATGVDLAMIDYTTSSNGPAYGFHKFVGNTRTPATGLTSIPIFYWSTSSGFTERWANGSDVWLNLWSSASQPYDTTNSYILSDNQSAQGTKCVAGYCYLNEPLWIMYR